MIKLKINSGHTKVKITTENENTGDVVEAFKKAMELIGYGGLEDYFYSEDGSSLEDTLDRDDYASILEQKLVAEQKTTEELKDEVAYRNINLNALKTNYNNLLSEKQELKADLADAEATINKMQGIKPTEPLCHSCQQHYKISSGNWICDIGLVIVNKDGSCVEYETINPEPVTQGTRCTSCRFFASGIPCDKFIADVEGVCANHVPNESKVYYHKEK